MFGKAFKNLMHEMFVHLLRINASVKRVVLCLSMPNNLKIRIGLVFSSIGLKMTELEGFSSVCS
jgi:hypothetical protein